ncbi:MAG: formate-dependent phosphoribosylglycinamide formyltransferase [Deltaproteobacteria bacterium]|nr:formate-dependent phosphoribosylglycinamide formyltransferase [Deltaproteobacteria bacterium]
MTQPVSIGTPLSAGATRVLLLGAGELGKEVVLELQRFGVELIACDRYANAPAMQVAHRSHVIDMLDRAALRRVVETEKPHLIVPEIEAIATQELIALEAEGWTVIPTAQAARLTMDREAIRRVAAEELDLPTARYQFADTFDELKSAAKTLGWPVVIKPIMSSSGKGQSVAKTEADLEKSWQYAQTGGRTGAGRVIVEEFIQFESEITMLTVRAVNGTMFCDPVGHRQVGGDYVESWQPHPMSALQIERSQAVAKRITDRLGGRGIFGVELFLLSDDRVMFSEVSPRPHDTGMVTMGTQVWSQFALHARAILGLPIPTIRRHSAGASVALRADGELRSPVLDGLTSAYSTPNVDVRFFGKPNAVARRRLGVVLATGDTADVALATAKRVAGELQLRDA